MTVGILDENDECNCSECGRVIRAEESLWVSATETICEECYKKCD